MVREKPQDGGEPNALNLEGGVLALEPLGTGESTAGRHPHVTSATLFLVTHLRHRRSSSSRSLVFFLSISLQATAVENNGRESALGNTPGHL